MTTVLTLLGKLKDRERKLLEIFLVVILAAYINLSYVLPKWKQIKVNNNEITNLKKTFGLQQEKSKTLTDLETEKADLTKEYETLSAKQSAISIANQSSQSQDFVLFFNDWARFAKENDVKIISLKPANSKESFSLASGEVAVNIQIESNFISLLNFFTKLDIYGRIPKIENFSLQPAKNGYPNLAADIVVSLILK